MLAEIHIALLIKKKKSEREENKQTRKQPGRVKETLLPEKNRENKLNPRTSCVMTKTHNAFHSYQS